MTTVHKRHRQTDGQTDWHHSISARCIITSHLALKTGPNPENSRKYLPFGENIVKIGLVDTEIALLILKNKKKINKEEEINASKIYSPVGRFAEQYTKNANL